MLGLVLTGCGKKKAIEEDEPLAKTIPVADLPYATLNPHADGYRLDVKISNIKSPHFGYQVIYTAILPNGNSVERGAGTRDADLQGKSEIVKENDSAVVFGSASSGKFRYDEGVENGQLEVTYRDGKGKATGRAQTEWHLQSAKKYTEYTSMDNGVKFIPTGKPSGYFLIMNTLGVPAAVPGTILTGPYAVLNSGTTKLGGKLTVTLSDSAPAKLLQLDEQSKSWKEITSSQADSSLTASISSLGTFVVASR